MCPAPPLLVSNASLQHKNDALEKELAEVKLMLAAINTTVQDSAGNENKQGNVDIGEAKVRLLDMLFNLFIL